jgi:hypothetical protein
MKLWQNEIIVNELKRILEKYDYLEYDEADSKRSGNGLKVKVTDAKAKRNSSVPCKICEELSKATGRSFSLPNILTNNPPQNPSTDWQFFYIRKQI